MGQSRAVTLDLEELVYSLNQELAMKVGMVVELEVRGLMELLETVRLVVVEPLLTEHLTQVVAVVDLVLITVMVVMVLLELTMAMVAVVVGVEGMPAE